MAGMNIAPCIQIAALWLAAALWLPTAALAAPPISKAPVLVDVQLRNGGLLLGQVVRPDGSPLPGARVSLRSGNQDLASGTTDRSGYFAFSGLRTGTYQVAAANGIGTYQLWTADIAPPAAQRGALLVAGMDTVRGQHTPEQFGQMLARPVIVGGLIGAAIAVPIAVSNSHREPASAH
jgi:hypothetical protein